MTTASGDKYIQDDQVDISSDIKSSLEYDELGGHDSLHTRTLIKGRRRSRSASSVNVKEQSQNEGGAPVEVNQSVTRTGSLPEVNGLNQHKLRDFIALKESSCPKLQPEITTGTKSNDKRGDALNSSIELNQCDKNLLTPHTILSPVSQGELHPSRGPNLYDGQKVDGGASSQNNAISQLIEEYHIKQVKLQEQLKGLQEQCHEKEFHMKKMTDKLCKCMVKRTKLEHKEASMMKDFRKLSDELDRKSRRLTKTEFKLEMTEGRLLEMTKEKEQLEEDYKQLCETQTALLESSVVPLQEKIQQMTEDRRKLRKKIIKLKDLLRGKENQINATENELLAHKILLDTLKHVVSPDPSEISMTCEEDVAGAGSIEQYQDTTERQHGHAYAGMVRETERSKHGYNPTNRDYFRETAEQDWESPREDAFAGGMFRDTESRDREYRSREEIRKSLKQAFVSTPRRGAYAEMSRDMGRHEYSLGSADLNNGNRYKSKKFTTHDVLDERELGDDDRYQLFEDEYEEAEDIFSNDDGHSSLLSGPLTFPAQTSAARSTLSEAHVLTDIDDTDTKDANEGGRNLVEGLLLRKQELDNHYMKARDRSWHYIYVVQRDGHLTFYDNKKQEEKDIQKDSTAHDLRGAIVNEAADYSKRKNVFRVRLGSGIQYLFQAQDRREMMFWICSMDSASKGERYLPEDNRFLQPQSGSPGKVDRLQQFIRGGISALTKI